jgi:hypothetical protein
MKQDKLDAYKKKWALANRRVQDADAKTFHAQWDARQGVKGADKKVTKYLDKLGKESSRHGHLDKRLSQRSYAIYKLRKAGKLKTEPAKRYKTMD